MFIPHLIHRSNKAFCKLPSFDINTDYAVTGSRATSLFSQSTSANPACILSEQVSLFKSKPIFSQSLSDTQFGSYELIGGELRQQLHSKISSICLKLNKHITNFYNVRKPEVLWSMLFWQKLR